MLSFDQYQREVAGSKVYPRLFTEDQVREMLEIEGESIDRIIDEYTTPLNYLLYAVLGLVGEAGEIANKTKKIVRDHNGVLNLEHEDALGFEAGDTLWYLAAMADALRIPLSDIAEENLSKIASREARGKIKGEGDHR